MFLSILHSHCIHKYVTNKTGDKTSTYDYASLYSFNFVSNFGTNLNQQFCQNKQMTIHWVLVLSELSNILEDVSGCPSVTYYYSWEQYKLKCSCVNDNLQVSYHHVDF